MYEVFFDFDDRDADVVTSRAYFSALEKYGGGLGICHQEGTSSMIVPDFSILNLVRELKLEGIKLIRFSEL